MPVSTRDIWRDPTKVNFAKIYNDNRSLEAAEQKNEGLSVRNIFTGIQSQLENSAKAAEGYTIIRSDVDDDREDLTLSRGSVPRMRAVAAMVRQSEPWNQVRRQDEDEDNRCCAWVDTMWFQTFSGLVIMANAVMIGLETDIETDLWWWVDQSMLTFFVLELSCKICRNRLDFFKNEDELIWNLFDTGIVFSGVCDQWLMPILTKAEQTIEKGHEGSKRSHLTVVFMLLRMARLLRIVRVFRLIKIIRPLYELAQGILAAAQGMFWVLVFLTMTLYATALLCTLFIGSGEVFIEGTLDSESEPFRTMFHGVTASLFALFGTMSSWSLSKLVPLFIQAPFFRLFFVIFYIYSSWALLAVMTGVVSENMIAIREQMLKEEARREEKRKGQLVSLIQHLFDESDTDGSGTISKEEFQWMLKSPELCIKLKKFSKVSPADLDELFNWIDHDGSGTISQAEFMDGFKWVNQPLRAASLIKLYERLGDHFRIIKKSVGDAIEKKSEEVNKLLKEPLSKIHAICELFQSLDVHFGDLSQIVQSRGEVAPSIQELQEVEMRLCAKLEKVKRRLDEVENLGRGGGGG